MKKRLFTILLVILTLVFYPEYSFAKNDNNNGQGNEKKQEQQEQQEEKKQEQQEEKQAQAEERRAEQEERQAQAEERRAEQQERQTQAEERRAEQQERQVQAEERRAEQQERSTQNEELRVEHSLQQQNAQEENSFNSNRESRGERDSEHNRERIQRESRQQTQRLFAALEHARWWYNPSDNRGQGNMGRPDMQDPYGFDKNSGREKKERGRPHRSSSDDGSGDTTPEPQPVTSPVDDGSTDTSTPPSDSGDIPLPPSDSSNSDIVTPPLPTPEEILAAMTTVNVTSISGFITYLQGRVTYYQGIAQSTSDPTMANTYTRMATIYQTYIQTIEASSMEELAINHDNITYNLSFNAPEDWLGRTLTITTSLVSSGDYSYPYYYSLDTRTYIPLTYSTDQIISQDTHTVVMGENTSLSYTYNPPDTIAPTGGYTAPSYSVPSELVITVTEPISGASYSYTYERELMLWRCPYGIVRNTKTNTPIVGAKVTVHYEDGSIVTLDKAMNPSANNPQITDAMGRYGCKLEINKKYYLTASAQGYETYKSPLFTEKWHVLREDISMTPLNK